MRRIIIALIISFLTLVTLTVPVLALDDPDSLSIESVKVFRNTVETGDMVVIFEYNINYTSIPDDPLASDSFMFRLYDTDGTTLRLSQVPYVVFNQGYGIGCGSFYFSAADSPTWGAQYVINISGSPAYFSPLPTPTSHIIQSTEYSTVTDQEDNQALAYSYILSIAKDIQDTYAGLSLWGSSDTGDVLSADGEVYFRGAIPGVTSIAPDLFLIQSYVPTTMDMTYNNDLATEYGDRLDGTDLMTGLNRLGTKLGTDGQTVADIFAILASLALVLFTSAKGWGIDPGLIGAGIILTMFAVLLGDALLTIRLAMGFIVGVIFFYQVALKRA